MTPTTNVTLDPVNQAFYSWLMMLCAYVERTYQIVMFPTWTQVATPGLNSDNPQQVDNFFLTCPQLGKRTQVGLSDQGYFTGLNGNPGVADLATIILTEMTYPARPPQPISMAPIVVVPPAPLCPMGDAFTDLGEEDYTNLNQSVAIGTLYNNNDPSVAPIGTYVLKGRKTPFGTQTWWTKAPAQNNVVTVSGQTVALMPGTVA